jgi:hypothetical protein
VETFVEACRRELDLSEPPNLAEFDYGGLPQAVLEAVFSIGARAAVTKRVVCRFCSRYGYPVYRADVSPARPEPPLEALVQACTEAGGYAALADLLGNHRPVLNTSARPRPLQAELAVRLAQVLLDHGVRTLADMGALREDPERLEALRAEASRLPGLDGGTAVWEYLHMLTGDTTRLKPDRMVESFVRRALPEGAWSLLKRPERLRRLFAESADVLRAGGIPWITVRALDNLIWRQGSTAREAQAAQRRRIPPACRNEREAERT